MKQLKSISAFSFLVVLFFHMQGCAKKEISDPAVILIEAESYMDVSGKFQIETSRDKDNVISVQKDAGWLAYDVTAAIAGRYKCEIKVASISKTPVSFWVEDYYDNKDGRTYNITNKIEVPNTGDLTTYEVVSKDGSPLNAGQRKMKFHVEGDSLHIDWIKFTLLKKHQLTPQILTQKTEGTEWKLVWSDEFDGSGLPDTSKWAFDIGNWGWGNNEPQYYTESRIENARQENGNLIIEARKNDMDQPWTSARLTTRGKVGFVYGKFEFKAKVPSGDGTWAAGWFLGDAYRDELSWPYCGEIDVLECVGREIDDQSGDGINHASCHTRAYYFKEGNHLTNIINVKNMTDEYHTYAIEWTPKGINAYLDGKLYYTYDKLNGELEWPFNNPQNIIINLAMGGGMGGTIDDTLESQKLIVDYIRVYEKI